ILANAGGVTTSYFEWVQDRQGYFWKESVVNEHLGEIMVAAFEDVVRYSETHGVNNRIAAYMLAIDRVAYTIRQRGIYPWLYAEEVESCTWFWVAQRFSAAITACFESGFSR